MVNLTSLFWTSDLVSMLIGDCFTPLMHVSSTQLRPFIDQSIDVAEVVVEAVGVVDEVLVVMFAGVVGVVVVEEPESVVLEVVF